MGMLPPEEAPQVRAEAPKRVEAPPQTTGPTRPEQDELAAALEELEAEQQQQEQRKAGR